MAKFKPGVEIDIDLDMLRHQRDAVRRAIIENSRFPDDYRLLDGLINMIDSIEDNLTGEDK